MNGYIIYADGEKRLFTIDNADAPFMFNEKIKNRGILRKSSDYFCPYDYTNGEMFITSNTRAIHWYDSSWLDKRMSVRKQRQLWISKRFKGKM